jgi:hypothetical protein
MNKGRELRGKFVVSGGHGSELLETEAEAFDQILVPIEISAERAKRPAIGAWRDSCLSTLRFDGCQRGIGGNERLFEVCVTRKCASHTLPNARISPTREVNVGAMLVGLPSSRGMVAPQYSIAHDSKNRLDETSIVFRGAVPGSLALPGNNCSMRRHWSSRSNFRSIPISLKDQNVNSSH